MSVSIYARRSPSKLFSFCFSTRRASSSILCYSQPLQAIRDFGGYIDTQHRFHRSSIIAHPFLPSMEDSSVASSPGADPYVSEDNTLSSIEDIPELALEPTTDVEDLTDHGTATDLEGTTQIDFYNDIDLEKGRPSLEDSLNYDGHDVSALGSKVLDAMGLHPLEQERTNTSLEGSVQEFFEGHEEAKEAMDYEQNLTLWYTIRHFTPALFWALCMGALTITDGYESTLLSNLQAYQPFLRHFGDIPMSRFQGWTSFSDLDDVDENGVVDFALPIGWQMAINLAPAFGALIGLVSAARLVNWLGYRQCGMMALVAATIFLSIPPISTIDLGIPKFGCLCIFTAGEGLLGMPWGLLSGIVTSYVSDVTPLRLRVFATTMINIFWLIGAELSILSVAGFDSYAMRTEDLNNPQNHTRYPFALEEKDHWTFRGPMLIQFLWILPLLFIICRAPDSPLF